MKECRRCHAEKPFSEFYVCAGNNSGYQSRCILCCKLSASEWNKANRARINARRPKKGRAVRFTREQKLAKKREMERRRYENHGSVIRARIKKWKQSNPHVVGEINARRKAVRKSSTPAWADTFALREAYELRRMREAITGGEWHVDHIVPLQHPLVCGLHNEFNVKVIPASVNCSKQNRYWPDMPSG